MGQRLVKLNSTLSFIVLVLGLCCTNTTVSVAKTKDYEAFFVGDGISQYYIKPITFNGEDKQRVEADITYRVLNDSIYNVVLNFSLYSSGKVYYDSIQTISVGDSVVLKREQFYNRMLKVGKAYELRVSTLVSPDVLRQFDDATALKVCYRNGSCNVFVAKQRKQKKKLRLVQELAHSY